MSGEDSMAREVIAGEAFFTRESSTPERGEGRDGASGIGALNLPLAPSV
jgi:hypothetical protein